VIITKAEFLEREEFYANEIKAGKIFVYPTDTIYGIGCDATNAAAVNRIREIKHRNSKPYSIIVPSKEWVKENCIVPEFEKEHLNGLPGKFTLIFKMKNEIRVARKELVGNFDTIGARIPDNWFA